jgi:hypothetical protein
LAQKKNTHLFKACWAQSANSKLTARGARTNINWLEWQNEYHQQLLVGLARKLPATLNVFRTWDNIIFKHTANQSLGAILDAEENRPTIRSNARERALQQMEEAEIEAREDAHQQAGWPHGTQPQEDDNEDDEDDRIHKQGWQDSRSNLNSGSLTQPERDFERKDTVESQRRSDKDEGEGQQLIAADRLGGTGVRSQTAECSHQGQPKNTRRCAWHFRYHIRH